MKSLIEVIREAQTRSATGLRLVPGQPLQIRVNRRWINGSTQALQEGEVRESIWPLLTAEEKRRLDETRLFEGEFQGQSGPLRFQCLLHEPGLLLHLRWHNEQDRTLAEWGVPAFALERLQQQRGLNLVVGPLESGKSSFLRCLGRHLSESHGPIPMISDSEEFGAELKVPHIGLQSALAMTPSLMPSRFVIVDSNLPEARRWAFQLASQGKTVFLSVTAKSMASAMLSLAESQGTGVWTSLAENLVSAFGVRLLPGLESGLQPAFEFLSDTPEVKTELSRGSAFGLVEIMSKGGDKSGMRTLNQAILQLLIKRRIELRAGFDESPNPQELDELLKKVGV